MRRGNQTWQGLSIILVNPIAIQKSGPLLESLVWVSLHRKVRCIIRVSCICQRCVIGILDIEAGTELVFDYNVDRKGAGEESVRCHCGAPNCRNWLTGDGDEKRNEQMLRAKREERIQFLENAMLRIQSRGQSSQEAVEDVGKQPRENAYEDPISLESIPREVKEFQIPKKMRKSFPEPMDRRHPQTTSVDHHSNSRTSKSIVESSKKSTDRVEKDSTILPKRTFRSSVHSSQESLESSQLEGRLPVTTTTTTGHERIRNEPPGFGYEYLRLQRVAKS